MTRGALLSIIVVGAAIACSACILSSEHCREEPSYDGSQIPPHKRVTLEEIRPDSGLTLAEDAGPDAGPKTEVVAVVGTKEEWLAMRCEDACRRVRAEGLSGVPNATTSCSFETDHGPALGQGEPWLRCNFVRAVCTDYR